MLYSQVDKISVVVPKENVVKNVISWNIFYIILFYDGVLCSIMWLRRDSKGDKKNVHCDIYCTFLISFTLFFPCVWDSIISCYHDMAYNRYIILLDDVL